VTIKGERLEQAMRLLGSLVLDSGERWGAVATPLQRADAEAVLAGDDPRRHWLGRARGYSKTTDVAALLVVLLLMLTPASECVAAAADADQAAILVRRMRGLVTRTGVADQFDLTARRVTCKRTGSLLEVLGADGASAWGLLPAVVVLDELPMWPDTENAKELYDALTTALPKREGSLLVIMGTAGDPAGWAAQIRGQALADPANWRVSEPQGPPPWMGEAEIELERATRLPSTFARLFENRWVAGADKLTSPEQVRDCIGHSGVIEPRRGVRYVHGLDVGLINDRTVHTIAHRERRGEAEIVVVDHQEVWQGSAGKPVDLGVIEAYCREAIRKYPGRLIHDPWQSVHLAQRLRSSGVAVEAFTFSSASVGRLAVTLHRLLRDRLLDLPDDEDLVAELSSVVLRENQPGVYRIDHRAGAHDDRVISLALCAQNLASKWSGSMTLRAPTGRLPITTPTPAAAPITPAIVREGEKRPVDALTRFAAARRDPGYSGPRRQR
jgi:hypothetical protein